MSTDNEVSRSSAPPWAIALGRPSLHIVAGAAFALVFTWPILAFDVPFNTWTFLYVTWAVSIGVLFALSKGDAVVETDNIDDVEDGEDRVASLPPQQTLSIRPSKVN